MPDVSLSWKLLCSHTYTPCMHLCQLVLILGANCRSASPASACNWHVSDAPVWVDNAFITVFVTSITIIVTSTLHAVNRKLGQLLFAHVPRCLTSGVAALRFILPQHILRKAAG